MVDLGWEGNRWFKEEMISTKPGKRTYEHLSIVNGVRSTAMMSRKEKLAGKRKRATNDVAEAPFSMVKEGKQRCGTNMSVHKCAGEAMMRANHFLERTVTETGVNLGWFHTQPDWVQECIVTYAEEKAIQEDKNHKKALKKFGKHLLDKFELEVKKQNEIEWQTYEASVKFLGLVFTTECTRIIEEVDIALANLNKKHTLLWLKEQFKIWEKGAGWNRKFGKDTVEYSEDGIERYDKENKLIDAGSTEVPHKILWPHVHQAYSRRQKVFSNDYLTECLKKLILEQVQGGRPVRREVPLPSIMKKDMSAPFGTPSWDYVALKKECNPKEVKRVEAMQAACSFIVQPKNMPTAASLTSKKIKILFREKDSSDTRDNGVLT